MFASFPDLDHVKSKLEFVFIGAGPMPLSAIYLHKITGGAKVLCVDVDKDASAAGAELIARVGLR